MAGRLDARIDEASTGELEHPRGRLVSSNYFSVLGVKPQLGRVLDSTMDRVYGSSPVAVISHGYWTRRFQNNPAVLGKEILVNGIKFTIIGVAPDYFTGEIVGQSPDMWLPYSMNDALHPNMKMLDDRSSSWMLLLGRLKTGATLAQAQQEVPAIIEHSTLANGSRALSDDYKASKHKFYIASGSKGFSRVRSTFQAPLLTLMCGVALLLCIICANVANLLLARSVARGREMAVRLALGADRARLIRQLLTESVVLALLSAVAGLLVAWWGSKALLVLTSSGSTIPLRLSLDLPVLGFTLAVSILAVGLFGLAPALRASRVELASTMRASTSSVSGSALGGRGGRLGAGKLLIGGQVALSVVLLMGATMLVRSLRNVQSIDVGMDRDHLIVADLDINSRGYHGPSLATAVQSIKANVAAVPGVAAVTVSENGIFSGTDNGTSVQVPGFVPRATEDTLVSYDEVGKDYVGTVGGRLLAGRDMGAEDEGRLPRTALVNESLARFYFPTGSAVGRFLRLSDSVSVEIVGVLADTHDHDLTTTPARRVYFPYLHSDDTLNLSSPGSMRLIVRTKGDPSALVQSVRKAIVAADPQLPIDSVDPLSKLMEGTINDQRLVAQLATGFGVLALLLAAIGLYGVMTYAITRRTGEIGLRVALGARRTDVVRMIVLEALRVVVGGVVVGLPLALLVTRLLRTQLHDVSAADPVSIGVAVSVLIASGVLAATLPAIRASRVSPILALRSE
jgi:predicted permease